MTYETIAIYYAKFECYKHGLISESDWLEFCKNLLEDIMEENTDVLERLKNR